MRTNLHARLDADVDRDSLVSPAEFDPVGDELRAVIERLVIQPEHRPQDNGDSPVGLHAGPVGPEARAFAGPSRPIRGGGSPPHFLARRDSNGAATSETRMPPNGESPLTTIVPLTQREMVVVFLMSAGHTTAEIAKLLELRPSTVENRKRQIYEKLGVGSQSHAVAKAIWLGLLQTGRPATVPLRGSGRPQHAGEPGRATLAVLMGPAGQARDEVAQLLISERTPLVVALKRTELIGDHWVSWHRGPIVVVLIDPEPEDWSPAIPLGAPVVVVRSRDVPEELVIADALAHQASGLVAEADVATGLGPTLSAVTQGLLVMSWGYAEALLKWAPNPSAIVPQLTGRECDILVSIASGHTIRQTARALGIAAKTVENTQARLYRKLGARNRLEMLTIADAWGLIDRAVLPDGQNSQAATSQHQERDRN
jgi:DNA-binding CsgD family transcriptional regulator